MTPKYKFVLLAAVIAITFALGRYSVQSPAIKTTVDTVTSRESTTDRDTHRETTTVTEKDPKGTVKTTTKIVEDTTTKREAVSGSVTHVEQTVTPAKVGTLNVSALAGVDVQTFKSVYGASVTKQILGPISVGVFGLTNGSVGLSLGVSF